MAQASAATQKGVASAPQSKQLARTSEPPHQKKKEQIPPQPSVQITKSRGGRVKVNKSRTLVRERGGLEREHEEERVDSTVKGRFQGGEKG